MDTVSATSPRGKRASDRPAPNAEATETHTRILGLALAVEESRSYWENVDPSTPVADRATVAFEGRWFGSKSLERVRFLLPNFEGRYDAFPDALNALRRWRSMDMPTRQNICHWHLQLSDPLYRDFTGRYLVDRRASPDAKVDRDVVFRWVKTAFPDRWSDATCIQFASKLLSAASEAGLVSPKRDPRSLLVPKVTDVALTYLLYLLRQRRFAGTLTENPYLTSVGLTDSYLEQRLGGLTDVTFRRMAHLIEFDWAYPSLASWAEMAL